MREEFKSMRAFAEAYAIGHGIGPLNRGEADLKEWLVLFERRSDANAFAKAYPMAHRL